jgi:hypothetical protein
MPTKARPEHVTHEDLWEEIRLVERSGRDLVLKITGAGILLGLSGMVYVWQSEARAVEAITRVEERVEANSQQVQAAMDSQERIESGLSEISRYMREDGREQREAMNDHIRSEHRTEHRTEQAR